MEAFRTKYGKCQFGWSGWKGSLVQLVEMTRDKKYPCNLLLEIPDTLDVNQFNVFPETDSTTINKRFLRTTSAMSNVVFPGETPTTKMKHIERAQTVDNSQLNLPIVIKIINGFVAGATQRPFMCGEIFIVLAIKTQKRVKLLTERDKVATLPISTSVKFYQVRDYGSEDQKQQSLKSIIKNVGKSGNLVIRVADTFKDEDASSKLLNGNLRYLECYEEYFLICFPIQNEDDENYPTENDQVILPAYYPVSVATAKSYVDASGKERLEELFKVFSKNLIQFLPEASHKFEELTLSPFSEDVYEPIENTLSYRRDTKGNRQSQQTENKRYSLARREAFAFESKLNFEKKFCNSPETHFTAISESNFSTEQYEPIQPFIKTSGLKQSPRCNLPEITIASNNLLTITKAESSYGTSEIRSVMTRRLTEEKNAELSRSNFSRQPRKRSDPYPKTPTIKKEQFQLNKFDFNNPTDDLTEPMSRTKVDKNKVIFNKKTALSKSMVDIQAALKHETRLDNSPNYPTISLSRKKTKWQKNKQAINPNFINDPDEEENHKSRKSSSFNMFLKHLVSGFTIKDKELKKKNSWSFVASPTPKSDYSGVRGHGIDRKISVNRDLDTEIPLSDKLSISNHSSLEDASVLNQYDEIATTVTIRKQRSKKTDYRERTLSRSLDDLSPIRDLKNTLQNDFIPESVFRERFMHSSRGGFSGSRDPEDKPSLTRQKTEPLFQEKNVTGFSPFRSDNNELENYEIYEDNEENNYEEIFPAPAENLKADFSQLASFHGKQEADNYLDMGSQYMSTDSQRNSKSGELVASSSSKWISFDQIPTDLSGLLVNEVSMCLDLLNLGKYVRDFAEQQIDGRLLCLLSEDILQSDLKLNKLEALKLTRFIKDGWRPK